MRLHKQLTDASWVPFESTPLLDMEFDEEHDHKCFISSLDAGLPGAFSN